MIFYVYLLIAKKNSRYFTYAGYTKDLKKRILLHNTGKGAKYTRGKKWIPIYKKRYNSKSLAMIEEYKLKKNISMRSFLKKKYINK